jgi:hypothetical protein
MFQFLFSLEYYTYVYIRKKYALTFAAAKASIGILAMSWRVMLEPLGSDRKSMIFCLTSDASPAQILRYLANLLQVPVTEEASNTEIVKGQQSMSYLLMKV